MRTSEKRSALGRVLCVFLALLMLASLLPVSAVMAFAESRAGGGEEVTDEMEAILSDTALDAFRQGETQHFDDDGYIGIPYEVTVYYDATKGAAKTGYLANGGTVTILYVVNATFERVGTLSDVEIITSMLERGYAVAVLDYLNNEKAVSPELDYSAQLLRSKLGSGAFFTDSSVFSAGTYSENVVVPSGYDVNYSDVYFELDRHGTNGTLDKIVNVWNNDFRLYKKNVIVKWVNEDGSRKSTQSGFDGSSPVWYSDASGKTVDADGGEYTQVQYTHALEITDCVKADGTPIDLDLYITTIYPTEPERDVPVMTMFSSAGDIVAGNSNTSRPQFQGFVFSGYAAAVFDYAWIPMGRNDHYGYFDGSSGSEKSVTGDNQSYATYTFNAAQTSTAAMRYVRYLSLSDHDTYSFNIDKVGVFGISKAAWMTQLGAPSLREDLYTSESGYSEEEIAELVNTKINSFYQQLWLKGHHGETRYDVGDTQTYTKNGFTVDGGELQPWAVYGENEISSGAQLIYSSCGASVDYMCEGYSPQFITVNLRDEYNTAYYMQNILVNLCRTNDIPALWYEADIEHTFAYGKDENYGVDIYEAFFRFCDYYLKDAAVSVSHTDPMSGSAGITAGDPITVKFIGEVSAEEIEKVTLTGSDGVAVSGRWTSAYGGTEWTFRSSELKGGEVYTLTVPAELKGSNGVAMGESYTAVYHTADELMSASAVAGEETFGEEGRLLSFTVPSLGDKYDRIKLRLGVTNDAANTLRVYSASSEGAKGELLGEVALRGAGAYEFDVTDYAMSLGEGETAYLTVCTVTASGLGTVFTEDFDSGVGSFSVNGYTSYSQTELDGASAVKVVVGTNAGKFGGEHEFYEVTNVLRSTKLINNGKAVTKADVGRRYYITVRLKDTVSRQIRLVMSGVTSQAKLLRDYDYCYYTFSTVAGEWCEFTVPYTVYEADYGASALGVKTFSIHVDPTGDTEMPIYFDSVTVKEEHTQVCIDSATLVCASESGKGYKSPVGTKPVRLGDAYYDTLADAIGAAASGDVITLCSDLHLTAAGAAKLSGKSVTLDLGGYRLICTDVSASPITLDASDTSAVSFTVKNGTVLLGDAPLISFSGSKSKNWTVRLEDVYFKLSDGAMTDKVMFGGSVGSGASVKADVTFDGCTVETGARVSYPVTLFFGGSDGLKIACSFVGGVLKLGYTNGLTVCDKAVTVSADADGGYLTAVLPSCERYAPELSMKRGDTYCGFALSSTLNGYNTYTVVDAENSTPYGVIPEQYADASKYPFVIFRDEVFEGTAQNWGAATNLAATLLANAPGEKVEILMRKDTVATASTVNLSAISGTVLLDLGGYSLTRSATLFECATTAAYSGGYATNIEVKNGTLLASVGHLFAFEIKSDKDKELGITLDGVTLALSEGSTSAYLFSRCWGTSGSGKINADIKLYDCIFELSGETAGTAAPTSKLTLFDFSNTSVNADVHVYGGEIKANATSLSSVTVCNIDSADSVQFVADESGALVSLSVPSGYVPSFRVPTEKGELSFSSLAVDGEQWDVYTLTDDTVATDYGYIPSAYSNAASYPFALFIDGKFVTAKATWADATGAASSALSSNAGKTVYILMRADSISTGSPKQLCFMSGTVVLDLGGYTLTGNNNTLFECGTNNYSGAFDTALKVKNGTILMGNGRLLVYESKVSYNKNFDISFEGVTFGVASSYNRTQMFFNWSASGSGKVTSSLTFKDCTFDLTAVTTAVNVFVTDAGNVDVDIKVLGGAIKANSLSDFTWYKGNSSGDSLRYGKGSNGSYTTLTLPTGAALSTFGGLDTDGVGVAFGDGKESDGKTTYVLTKSELVTKYGTIPTAYSSVSSYPFAMFSSSGFISASASWGAMTGAAKTYLDSNSGSTVYILQRADHVNTASSTNISLMKGTVVLDLGGHTLTRGGGRSLFEASTAGYDGSSPYASYLVVKNGVLLALNTATSNSGHIIAMENKVAYDKTMQMTFEGVTFGISSSLNLLSGDDINSILLRSWGNGSGITSSTYLTLDLKGCTFDFSGATAGTLVPTENVYIINVSGSDANNHITLNFSGGSFIGNLSKVKLLSGGKNDSINYKQYNGAYTEYILTSGSCPSGVQSTDKGEMYFTRVSSTTLGGASASLYRLGVKCAYGTIPYEIYTATDEYPYVLFMDGGYIGAKKTWTEATSMAVAWMDDLASDASKTVTILLMRDVTNSSGGAQLSAAYGTIVVDLNGHTLTSSATLFECEARHDRTTTVKVKNGTILNAGTVESRAIIALNRKTTEGFTQQKLFKLTFDDVTFGFAAGSKSTNLICINWSGNEKATDETLRTDMVFNNCTFDIKTNAVSGSVRMINGSGDTGGYSEIRAVINGGKLVFGTWSSSAILLGTKEDTLTFGKGSDGSYTTLELSQSVEIKDVLMTAEGESAKFTETETAGTYVLTVIAKTEGYCGKNVKWSFDEETGTLTISGKGAMKQYSATSMPWYHLASKITKVVIGEGVTSIGKNTFNNTKAGFVFTEITLPSTLTSIGNYAFYECTSLTNVNIPASVSSIGKFAFRGTALKDHTLGKCGKTVDWMLDNAGTLIIYGDGAMYDYGSKNAPWASYKDQIKSVVICEGVTNIGNCAFYECASIESVKLASTVTSIGNYAFYSCKALTEMTIPAAVSTIGAYAFRKCTALTTATFESDGGWSYGDASADISADALKTNYKSAWTRG